MNGTAVCIVVCLALLVTLALVCPRPGSARDLSPSLLEARERLARIVRTAGYPCVVATTSTHVVGDLYETVCITNPRTAGWRRYRVDVGQGSVSPQAD
jgi:hypothetical protein